MIHAIVAGLSADGLVLGMQTIVVNPPAAAARAPDLNGLLGGLPRLAEVDVQVDQSRRDDQPGGVG